jgi:NAD(P)-dependent dehydrogenase (short-subunit alcohol dehydrogenase family)
MPATPPFVKDRTVLITGATRGIGFAASLALARLGARLILVGRHRGRLDAAIAAVRRESRAEPVGYLCDVSALASVRALAADVLRRHPAIHVLINNAGGAFKRRSLTVDGIERTFATNHLGPFLLTTLLLERVVASAPARIVTVTSIGHRDGTLDFDDLGFERGYWIMKAYRRSKLANVLFANELARRLTGTGVTSNSVHPGAVATHIWSGAPLWTKPYIALFLRPRFISAEAGSANVVRLAADPALEGVTGQYFEEDCPTPSSPLAQDASLARRLWGVSEALTAPAAAPRA